MLSKNTFIKFMHIVATVREIGAVYKLLYNKTH